MPHYKDGREAKVGDHVRGRVYNTPHEVAGTIVSITPGVDSCNAQVQYTQVFYGGATPSGARPRMALAGDPRCAKAEQHGTAGEDVEIFACADYCAVSDLELVARPADASPPVTP